MIVVVEGKKTENMLIETWLYQYSKITVQAHTHTSPTQLFAVVHMVDDWLRVCLVHAQKKLGQIKTVTRWTFVSFINLLDTLSSSKSTLSTVVVLSTHSHKNEAKHTKNGITTFLAEPLIFISSRIRALLSLPLCKHRIKFKIKWQS